LERRREMDVKKEIQEEGRKKKEQRKSGCGEEEQIDTEKS